MKKAFAIALFLSIFSSQITYSQEEVTVQSPFLQIIEDQSNDNALDEYKAPVLDASMFKEEEYRVDPSGRVFRRRIDPSDTDGIKEIIVPPSSANIGNIRSINSAKKFIFNRLDCLFRNEHCSRQEMLILNYALGFLVGAVIPHNLLTEILTRKVSSNTLLLSTAQLITEQLIIQLGPQVQFLTLYTRKLINHFLTALCFLVEARRLAIIRYEKSMGLGDTANLIRQYISANTKCIWSEKYCYYWTNSRMYPQIFYCTEGWRRQILFYWMGYLSGLVFKKATATITIKPSAQLSG